MPLRGCQTSGLVLIGAVAATRNDFALPELVCLRNGIAAIVSADAVKVRRKKAPMPVFGSDLRRSLAVLQIGHGHPGGFGVDCLGCNANHGALEVKVIVGPIE